MAGLLIAVVYAANSGVAKRTIISDGPDDDALLVAGWPHLQQGEAIHVVAKKDCLSPIIEHVADAILSVHGAVVTPAKRCAVVDATGAVVDHVIADPVNYHVPAITDSMLAHKADLVRAHPTKVIPDVLGPFTLVESSALSIGDMYMPVDKTVRFRDRVLPDKAP